MTNGHIIHASSMSMIISKLMKLYIFISGKNVLLTGRNRALMIRAFFRQSDLVLPYHQGNTSVKSKPHNSFTYRVQKEELCGIG